VRRGRGTPTKRACGRAGGCMGGPTRCPARCLTRRSATANRPLPAPAAPPRPTAAQRRRLQCGRAAAAAGWSPGRRLQWRIAYNRRRRGPGGCAGDAGAPPRQGGGRSGGRGAQAQGCCPCPSKSAPAACRSLRLGAGDEHKLDEAHLEALGVGNGMGEEGDAGAAQREVNGCGSQGAACPRPWDRTAGGGLRAGVHPSAAHAPAP
jgi:hypothetical protein